MRAPSLATLLVGFTCVTLGFAACSSKGGGAAHPTGDSGAPSDASQASDAPLVCPPAPLGDANVGTYHHAQPVQPTACTLLLLNDYYTSCLGPDASVSNCDQSWGAGEDTTHATCQGCILTPSSATQWGPLVDYTEGGEEAGPGGTVSVNVAGCIELTDPSQLTCAESVQQADLCQHDACDAVCPVSDAVSFANWEACVGAAANGECLGYVTSAACVNGEDAGPAATCVTGSDFQDEFLAVATVFCGGAALAD